MSRGESSLVVRAHEDPSLFLESVNFTTAETAFASRLIEKDYFCTVLLAYLAGVMDDRLVFKGGTCLATRCMQISIGSAKVWTSSSPYQ